MSVTFDGRQTTARRARATFVSNMDGAIGGAGRDTLNASAASTAMNLDGRGGDDTLTGGNGGDTLRGGTGRDTMTGGGGTDAVVYDDHDRCDAA